MYTFCMDEKLPKDTVTLTAKVRKILKDPDSEGFLTIAALVLSHRNDPETMWKDYMEPAIFYNYWPAIKEKMLHNNWGTGNIPVWQAAYEKLAVETQKVEPFAKKKRPAQKAYSYTAIGHRLADLRSKAGMSQQELARKLKTSQQLISRIEKGGENLTLTTLFNIARVLKIRVKIDFGEKVK